MHCFSADQFEYMVSQIKWKHDGILKLIITKIIFDFGNTNSQFFAEFLI
jgi:hypothetical protein